MKIVRTALIAAACGVGLVSCTDDNAPVAEATFDMAVTQQENTVSVTVVPSDETVSYVHGLIMEDDYEAMGGQEGLTAYVEGLLTEGAELTQGTYSGLYRDLFWHTTYYLFAAQVSDGAVVGTPAVESVKTYRAYVEFAPEGVMIAPYAVSDNGLWVVGNYDDGVTPNSYVYDVRRDSLTIVNGVVLYDITDDGVAYGRDNFSPIIYADGETQTLTVEGNPQQSGFYGVSPDGSVAVGFSMDANWVNQAIIYENGTMSFLTGTDLTGHEPAGIVAKGIGSNGNIVGYLVDFERWIEVGCSWTGTGHEFDFYPMDHMVWNDELLDGGGAYEYRFGGLEIFTSPNGRYYTSQCEYTESWNYMPLKVYVYDTESDKMHVISETAYDDWRPCAVTSTGVAILADKSMGVSDYPYVYDINTGDVQLFSDYAAATYGYSAPEGVVIQGSILAVDESATVFVGNYTDDTSFYTAIYFMPEK